LLFNFVKEYALRRVQVNQDDLKVNGTHQLWSIYVLLVASKEVGLEVNAEKSKYIVMSRDQNAGRNHVIKNVSRAFERVEQFRCLGTTLTYQNSIQEEIKRRQKSGNA